MDFGEAWTAMKAGKKVTRAAWNVARSSEWVGLYISMMEVPAPFDPPVQIVCTYPGQAFVRVFSAVPMDLMADDWEIADDAV